MDILSRAQRSERMAKVRGRGNVSTEVALLRLLRAEKISGWRRHLNIVGVPDFAFPRLHVAVFVDGCFWHGCPHCRRNVPSNNGDFWKRKIASNRARDRVARGSLRKSGWIVLRIWEHQFRNPKRVVAQLRRVLARAEALIGSRERASAASAVRKISRESRR
jgi:DNA mismatch endonuclease, patch repair protein